MAALKATAIFTLQSLKDWVKVPEAETQHDDVLGDVGNFVTDEIERLTDRIYVSRLTTQIFNGDGCTARKELWHYPVQTVSSFLIDGVVVPGTDYVVDLPYGVLWLKNRVFTYGTQNVSVTYTAGYALVDVPSDASQVAREMAKIVYDQWNSNVIAMNQISIGPATAIVRPDWPLHVKQALEALRREVRVI